MSKPLPKAEYVRECLDYDPETGVLTWKQRPVSHFEGSPTRAAEHLCAIWNARYAGAPAGSVYVVGYLVVKVDDRPYLAHRLAWTLVTGAWPTQQIDHINRVRHDNRWVNLREVTHSENNQNQRMSRSNTSGHTGVYWHALTSKWRASIGLNNRQIHIGLFETLEEAVAARTAAKLKYHPTAPQNFGQDLLTRAPRTATLSFRD